MQRQSSNRTAHRRAVAVEGNGFAIIPPEPKNRTKPALRSLTHSPRHLLDQRRCHKQSRRPQPIEHGTHSGDESPAFCQCHQTRSPTHLNSRNSRTSPRSTVIEHRLHARMPHRPGDHRRLTRTQIPSEQRVVHHSFGLEQITTHASFDPLPRGIVVRPREDLCCHRLRDHNFAKQCDPTELTSLAAAESAARH